MKRAFVRAAGIAALLTTSIVSALLVGRRRFDRLVRGDVEALYARSRSASAADGVVTAAMLADLPEPVRRYLTYTGVVGKPRVHAVHLRQSGTMHLAANQPEIPIDAEQWYSVDPPGFVWDGTLHIGPLPLARARDRYVDGRGNMRIAAGALVTVVDARGDEMDQSSMMRYLSEMIWFPMGFLGDNVTFEYLDDRSARVTLTDRGRSVTGTMFFDGDGRLTEFAAERYRMAGAGYELSTWSTPIVDYGELAGLRLPVRGKAVWKLPEGDLEYIDVTITELAYNAAR